MPWLSAIHRGDPCASEIPRAAVRAGTAKSAPPPPCAAAQYVLRRPQGPWRFQGPWLWATPCALAAHCSLALWRPSALQDIRSGRRTAPSDITAARSMPRLLRPAPERLRAAPWARLARRRAAGRGANRKDALRKRAIIAASAKNMARPASFGPSPSPSPSPTPASQVQPTRSSQPAPANPSQPAPAPASPSQPAPASPTHEAPPPKKSPQPALAMHPSQLAPASQPQPSHRDCTTRQQ